MVLQHQIKTFMRAEFLSSQKMNLENIQYISELAMQMKLNILLHINPFKPGDYLIYHWV